MILIFWKTYEQFYNLANWRDSNVENWMVNQGYRCCQLGDLPASHYKRKPSDWLVGRVKGDEELSRNLLTSDDRTRLRYRCKMHTAYIGSLKVGPVA